MQNWLKTTITNFPCDRCVKNAFEFIRDNPINVESRKGLIKWICSLKNHANEDEHKPTIDCEQYFQDNFSDPSECTSCSLINKPETTILKQSNNSLSDNDNYDFLSTSFFSDWDPSGKLPSLKSNFAFNSSATSVTENNPNPNNDLSIGTNNITQTFPSLAYFDEFRGQQGQQPTVMVQTPNGLQPMMGQPSQYQEPELDGILKPLDSLYTFPSSVVGTKPSDLNLAYTPEFVANLVSLINQIFLTNFGSLASISLSSVLLFAVSILAKNNLSYYDRLFLQNLTASLFFHAINYVNPRTKDEIIPMAKQFFDGMMSMDVEKMKKSLLYDGKNTEKKGGLDDSLLKLALMDENLDPAIKQKLILQSRGGKHIDIEKMKEPRNSILSLGADMSNSFASSSIRDVQNASQSTYDSILGGSGRAPGGGGGSGIMNKSSLEGLFNARARYNRDSPSMRDYNIQKRFASPSVIDSSGLDGSYDYILDNSLL